MNAINRWIFAVSVMLLCASGVDAAFAGTVVFRNFSPVSGAAVEAPFKAGAGTRADPDTATLKIADGASVVSFSLTVAGSGFTVGNFCELDWDDDAPGAPRESASALNNGTFSSEQFFSVPVARLGLSAGTGSRTVLYELDVDEEPYGPGDVKRYLQVTFVSSSGGSGNPGVPGGRTVSFAGFAADGGVTVETAFRTGAGTRRDPDTVTLRVADGAATASFRLTVAGGGFTGGSLCELDWDDDAPGAPAESVVVLNGGAFSSEQLFSVPVARLWPGGSMGTRTVFYSLEVDEEPYGERGDVERCLQVTFLKGDSGGVVDPGGSDSGGGGGCSAVGWGCALLLLPTLRRRRA